MEMTTNGTTPSPNLVARTVDLVLGWWDSGTHTQVPGLHERVTEMNARLTVLEADKQKFFRFGTKMLWVIAGIGVIPVIHSLGVPTDKAFDILTKFW